MAMISDFDGRNLRPTPRLATGVGQLWQRMAMRFLDNYRPERHYMRGPGPKWHEKHACAAVSDQTKH
jgi:hypothetical protein